MSEFQNRIDEENEKRIVEAKAKREVERQERKKERQEENAKRFKDFLEGVKDGVEYIAGEVKGTLMDAVDTVKSKLSAPQHRKIRYEDFLSYADDKDLKFPIFEEYESGNEGIIVMTEYGPIRRVVKINNPCSWRLPDHGHGTDEWRDCAQRVTYEGFVEQEIKGVPQLIYVYLDDTIGPGSSFGQGGAWDFDETHCIDGFVRLPNGAIKKIPEEVDVVVDSRSCRTPSRPNTFAFNAFMCLEERFEKALEQSKSGQDENC